MEVTRYLFLTCIHPPAHSTRYSIMAEGTERMDTDKNDTQQHGNGDATGTKINLEAHAKNVQRKKKECLTQIENLFESITEALRLAEDRVVAKLDNCVKDELTMVSDLNSKLQQICDKQRQKRRGKNKKKEDVGSEDFRETMLAEVASFLEKDKADVFPLPENDLTDIKNKVANICEETNKNTTGDVKVGSTPLNQTNTGGTGDRESFGESGNDEMSDDEQYYTSDDDEEAKYSDTYKKTGEFSCGGNWPIVLSCDSGNIYIASGGNSKLQEVDKDGKMIQITKLPAAPSGICENFGLMYVSLPGKRQINAYVIGSDISKFCYAISTNGKCGSIEPLGSDLVVAFPEERVVRIINESGDVLSETTHEFKSIQFVAVPESEKRVYVSDNIANEICVFTSGLRLLTTLGGIFFYKNPHGICVIKGYVYVCDFETEGCVLGVGGREGRSRCAEIPQRKLGFAPWSISRDFNKPVLYVCSKNGKVCVFSKPKIN